MVFKCIFALECKILKKTKSKMLTQEVLILKKCLFCDCFINKAQIKVNYQLIIKV